MCGLWRGPADRYIHCRTGVLRGRLNVIVCVLSLVLSNSWPQRLPLPGMEKLSLAGAGVPQRWEELQPKSEDLKIELLNELMAFVCHESCNGSCEKVMIQCVIAAGTIGPQTILLLKNWPGAPRGFFWELGEAQKGAPQYIHIRFTTKIGYFLACCAQGPKKEIPSPRFSTKTGYFCPGAPSGLFWELGEAPKRSSPVLG